MGAIAKIVGFVMVVLSWVSLAAIFGFLGWQMVKKQEQKKGKRK